MDTRWLYLAIAIAINISGGFGMVSSIFIPYIQRHYNLNSVSTIMVMPTISGILSALSLSFAGYLFDRYGHRPLISVSALCSFLSGILIGFMGIYSSWDTAQWIWYTIGAFMGLGAAATTASLTPTIMMWFPDRVPLVVSILMASSNASMAIWPRVVSSLLNYMDVFTVYRILYLQYAAVLLVLGVAILKKPRVSESALQHGGDLQKGFSIDRVFASMFIAMLFIATSSMVLINLLAPILTEGFIEAGIEFAEAEKILTPHIMSISGLVQVFAALLWGMIAQGIGVWIPLVSIYITEALSTLMLYTLYGKSTLALSLLIPVRLASYSGEPSLHWSAIAALYGFRNIGRVAAALNTAPMIASVIAPIVGGFIRDSMGSYRYVVLFSSILSFLAIVPLQNVVIDRVFRKKSM